MIELGADTCAARDAGTFWASVFGNDDRVEIEIGSGDGSFLVARATAVPRRNVLGVERAPRKARRVAARIARLGVPHVRTLHADAAWVLTMVPAASVSAYHVYFPDPWPKRRHGRRRLFTAPLVAALARTLTADGTLYVATDVGAYMTVIREAVLAGGAFTELAVGDDHPGVATGFARKYRAEGRTLHLARFGRRACGATPQGEPAAASKIRSS